MVVWLVKFAVSLKVSILSIEPFPFASRILICPDAAPLPEYLENSPILILTRNTEFAEFGVNDGISDALVQLPEPTD